MARIRRIEKGAQSVTLHKTEVDCFYQVVAGDDGERYLHLTTFGSDNRKSKPKSSQSIQLSKAIADELVEIIRGELG
jgi:5-methylcytosine-specific restriction protein B